MEHMAPPNTEGEGKGRDATREAAHWQGQGLSERRMIGRLTPSRAKLKVEKMAGQGGGNAVRLSTGIQACGQLLRGTHRPAKGVQGDINLPSQAILWFSQDLARS